MKSESTRKKYLLKILIPILVIVILYVSSKEGNKIQSVSNVVNVIIVPFQSSISYVINKFNVNYLNVRDFEQTKIENEKLKKKIDQMEKDNRELIEYRQKIKELKDALNIKEQFGQYDFVGANVIAKDAGNWFDVFTIDIGSKDGVTVNDPVITSKGLVGRVLTVDILSSKVISIIDNDCTVSARISKTRDLVLVKGDLTLKNAGQCKLDYIPNEVDLDVGDMIESSGFGGIFPKGIIVGKVVQVRKSTSELKKYAIIEPVADFRRIEEVFVLKNKVKAGG